MGRAQPPSLWRIGRGVSTLDANEHLQTYDATAEPRSRPSGSAQAAP